jgi:membrane protein implicated in regulation of membrane protease activity
MVFLLCLILAVFLPISTTWAAILIIVGCVLEVGEVVVLRRWSKRLDKAVPVSAGAETMIGGRGTVVSPCRPTGTVRIDGELWNARCEAGADRGAVVRVDALDELELVVSPVDDDS